MNLTVQFASLEVMALAGVRIAAFLVLAPPFNHGSIPMRIKGILAVALSLAMAPRALASAKGAVGSLATTNTAGFMAELVFQAFVGAALGFLVYLTFSAIQSAGALLDFFGGFSLAAGFDPMSQSNGAHFHRLYLMTATVLMFASDAHYMVFLGFARTFDALPLGATTDLGVLTDALVAGMTGMFIGALQIAGPLIVVLFLADIGLGLLTRVAPALNAFALGFPLKILLTLTLGATAYLALPHIVDALSDQAVSTVTEVGTSE